MTKYVTRNKELKEFLDMYDWLCKIRKSGYTKVTEHDNKHIKTHYFNKKKHICTNIKLK